jgi:predicted amino acid-binding ACT domain protein
MDDGIFVDPRSTWTSTLGIRPPLEHPVHRVEGTDRPGLGAKMTGAIADAGINLRGLSAATLGSRFAAYMAFDSPEDAEKAARAIKPAGAAKAPGKRSRANARRATAGWSRRPFHSFPIRSAAAAPA